MGDRVGCMPIIREADEACALYIESAYYSSFVFFSSLPWDVLEYVKIGSLTNFSCLYYFKAVASLCSKPA